VTLRTTVARSAAARQAPDSDGCPAAEDGDRAGHCKPPRARGPGVLRCEVPDDSNHPEEHECAAHSDLFPTVPPAHEPILAPPRPHDPQPDRGRETRLTSPVRRSAQQTHQRGHNHDEQRQRYCSSHESRSRRSPPAPFGTRRSTRAVRPLTPRSSIQRLFGAGHGTRTRDPELGKLVLYQLS
jgi:hypothetical protein